MQQSYVLGGSVKNHHAATLKGQTKGFDVRSLVSIKLLGCYPLFQAELH